MDGTAKTFVSPFNGKVVYSQASDPGWQGGGYVAIQSTQGLGAPAATSTSNAGSA
jgi:hypothetical protein